MQRQHCGIKMERESDHSNSDDSGAAAVTGEVGTNVSQLEERVRALVAEKGQLDADLAQAKSAVRPLNARSLARGRKFKNLLLKEISWSAVRRKVSRWSRPLSDSSRPCSKKSGAQFRKRPTYRPHCTSSVGRRDRRTRACHRHEPSSRTYEGKRTGSSPHEEDAGPGQ